MRFCNFGDKCPIPGTAGNIQGKRAQRSSKDQVEWLTTSPTLLNPVLVWSQQNHLRLLLIMGYFDSYCRCPRGPPRGNGGTRINECPIRSLPRLQFPTLWEPVCDIFVQYFDFGLKTSSFRLPYQRPSSSADCARELFKGSNGSASLVDCTRNKICWLGVRIFCDWRHKWSSFRVILAHVAWPRAQPLGQSVSLKFSLETRLESESFEPLIDILAFLVQKLWSKINKLINYLIT